VRASNVKFVNNIISPRPDRLFGATYGNSDTTIVWDYNLIDDGKDNPALSKGPEWGSHNVTGSARFVFGSSDPGSSNFEVLRDSPAIGAGDALDAPHTDFLGRIRPAIGPIDIGAFQSSIENK
jgi:hypothetical protein